MGIEMRGIEQDVSDLLARDVSGHNMAHVERVTRLALSFAAEEGADPDLVALIALLHDVDDYKLFGRENAINLTNATRIMDVREVDRELRKEVVRAIGSMGYNKYLEGIRPVALEGMVVSDADMCDAIGATGVLRTHAYALSKGNEFFDKTLLPYQEELSAEQYHETRGHSVQHFFDKLLKIPDILMTDAGKTEGESRRDIMIDFLAALFQEEGADEWAKHLREYVRKEQQ